MNEEKKYETIKRLVDEGGNKERAAMTLGITRRQVNRLIRPLMAENLRKMAKSPQAIKKVRVKQGL